MSHHPPYYVADGISDDTSPLERSLSEAYSYSNPEARDHDSFDHNDDEYHNFGDDDDHGDDEYHNYGDHDDNDNGDQENGFSYIDDRLQSNAVDSYVRLHRLYDAPNPVVSNLIDDVDEGSMNFVRTPDYLNGVDVWAGSKQNELDDVLDDVKRRVMIQTDSYSPDLRQYLDPVILNNEAMLKVKKTFDNLNNDPKYLSRSVAEFIHRLQSVREEPHARPDYGGGAVDAAGFSSDSYEGTYEDADVPHSDGGCGGGLSPPYRFGGGLGDGPSMPSTPPPSAVGRGGGPPAPFKPDGVVPSEKAGFMMWEDFHEHKLDGNLNMLDDRHKSLIAYAQAVEIDVPTPVGAFSISGLLGLIVAMLLPQDWLAYYKAQRRMLLLRNDMPKVMDQLKLNEYEDLALGMSKYLGGEQSHMTCLTYSNGSYGAITFFTLVMGEPSFNDGSITPWMSYPTAIQPSVVLPHVPKKLLKSLRQLPKSKMTILHAYTSKDKLVWSPGTAVQMNGAKYQTGPGYCTHLRQKNLSVPLRKALLISSDALKDAPTPVNCIVATIPAMLAWLHARNAYVTNIRVDGIDEVASAVEAGQENAPTTMAKFIRGPSSRDHQGRDPRVIVIHPDDADWVKTPLYWT